MTMTEPAVPRQFDLIRSKILKRDDVPALQIAVREAFIHAGYQELRGLDLTCDGETVTISGRVPTYYLKQLVQIIALAAPGVGRVNNEVHVC